MLAEVKCAFMNLGLQTESCASSTLSSPFPSIWNPLDFIMLIMSMQSNKEPGFLNNKEELSG